MKGVNSSKIAVITITLLTIIISKASDVLAHQGHPEEQIIDGIDNIVLMYGSIFLGLVLIIVIAFVQGRKAVALQEGTVN